MRDFKCRKRRLATAAATAILSILYASVVVERATAQLTSLVARKRQQGQRGLRNTKGGSSGDDASTTHDDYLFGRQASIMARRNLRKDREEDTQTVSFSSTSAMSMSMTYNTDKQPRQQVDDGYSNQPSSSTSVCKSIIAVGEVRIPNFIQQFFDIDQQEDPQQQQASSVNYLESIEDNKLIASFDSEDRVQTDETFVCELDDGLTVPIDGTQDQMNEMRVMLNSGSLISAQSTVQVSIVNTESIDGDGDGIAFIGDEGNAQQPIVTLPPGPVSIITNENQSSRKLAQYEGVKKVLVVRVTDMDGRSVGGDANFVSDKFFGTSGDKMTMKSGFDACSFGKFTITNDYGGAIDSTHLAAPGVVDVNVNIRLSESSQSTVRQASLNAVKQKLGISMLPGPFDYVVLVVEECYRVGTENCSFAAYAYVNHWLSLFRADYYKYPAVQMHEIGHNLNMAHSGGLDGATYTDHTCLMGNPLFSDDVGKMCFNPVKNYQINRGNGWYDDSKIIEFDTSSSTSWSGKIIGVAEYDNNPFSLPIVIKLESGGGGDWFVGFNRAAFGNADNVQGDDLVTVYKVNDGDGFGYSTSSLKSLLRSSQTYTISNWRSSGSNLYIKVTEINTESSPGYANVDIAFGGTAPPPGPGPGPPGSSFGNWLASLPPGLAISMVMLIILILFTCLCACYNKRMSPLGKLRSAQVDDADSYSIESFNMNMKSPKTLSYLGHIVHSSLLRDHSHHRHTMWNVTSGRVIGQVDFTPKDVWDTSADPREGHSDWLPEKMADIIGRTEAWCDIMTLGRPDGKFLEALCDALQKLAIRSKSKADERPIIVRIMLANYPAKPVDCNEVMKTLTENLPTDANLHLWVGAWRKSLSWNHAKLIAVDGNHLHTGGHNLWSEPYLSGNPVHDLSVEMEGKVALDGHHFADQQWKFIKDKQRTFIGSIIDKLPDALPLVKRTRVTVSEWPQKNAPIFPPQFSGENEKLVLHTLTPSIHCRQNWSHYPQSQIEDLSKDVPIISIGRLGSMVTQDRPSDAAILAMINSSRSIIRMVIQDLGPICVPGSKKALPGLTWPKEYLAAIGNAIYERGVDVELVLSNPKSMPGKHKDKDTHPTTPYGNGWDCVDVASEIIKAIQREHPSVDEAQLRLMINENLRICFVRHNKSSTYSDGNSIGLHAKHFIFDDIACYIGSQNLYDCDLAEWGVVIDDEDEVEKILEQYFTPMWRNSYTDEDVDVNRVMEELNVDRDG